MEAVDQFAVDIQLRLVGRGIADQDRTGAFVTGQPRRFIFRQSPTAVDPVHDTHVCWITCNGWQDPVPPAHRFFTKAGV